MNTARYRQLTRELAQCAGLPADDPFLETGLLTVNDVETLLFYDESFDPRRLQIRMDFGPLPPDHEHQRRLMLSLLAVNFVYGLGGLAVFSVDSSNAHAILTTQHSLDAQVTARDLLDILKDASAQAGAAWEQARATISTD